MKKIIIISISILVSILTFAGGMGRGNGNNGNNKGEYLIQYLESIPVSELVDTEKEALIYMIEEEKLARDVYIAMNEKWGLRIFNNISNSEQTHMNAILFLLNRYEIESPIFEEKGKFHNQELQTLYYQLIEKGNLSLNDALTVGATIEDLDIKDLQTDLTITDNQDIKTVFQNLMKGSRNHLRAFVSFLNSNEITYTAQYLTQEEIDTIIASEKERGMVDADGNPLFSPANGGRGQGCFRN